MLNASWVNLWAKTDRNGSEAWHPLILHMLDVAACVDAILMREPQSTRSRMAACLGMEWEDARPWLLLVSACHDLGKACPGFQHKWSGAPGHGLKMPRSPNTRINHAFVSQIVLSDFLCDRGWPQALADLVADAVGCHHGCRAAPTTLDRLGGDARGLGGNDWSQARRDLLEAILGLFKPSTPPDKKQLSGPEFMLLSGITSFADWIGSNEEWFGFGNPEDCCELNQWFQNRRTLAEEALEGIGWEVRAPLSPDSKTFEDVFGFPPRPLQQAVADALKVLTEPAILLVEAPMGEGKTEAAFFSHLELQRQFGHRGLYVALPTKATGNAMFLRTLEFLRNQGSNRKLDLQLLHGATLLNESFQDLRIASIHDPESGGETRASEWFTHKKRALLSEYGVGTVDQALLPILPVRHHFVRLWGLANRVVVFDEIHAYDAYTGTLLIQLIRWLRALGSSVVLLSATLPPSFRRKLAGVVGVDLPECEPDYPRLSVLRSGALDQRHFVADPARRRTVRLLHIPPDLPGMRSAMEEYLTRSGIGLILVNTVQRAQDMYRHFPAGEPLEHEGRNVGKRLSDGIEVFLFHARFPADNRQQREELVLKLFGKSSDREGRKLLIATQVAEQSLDLDFDWIATDLAPIDLVLQRAGRLWRHERGPSRPLAEPTLMVAGIDGCEPPSFGKPLWWGAVYREDVLLRTWSVLSKKEQLTLPDEIDALVQAVYEERVEMPECLRDRLENAMITADGEAMALTGQANQAIIGLPDDASWNQPERFVLYDEDEPGVHRTLMAQTRVGEDSVVAIPLGSEDDYSPAMTPDFDRAREWALRALSLSRKGPVRKLREMGIPEGWKQSPLLRNCFPLELDSRGCWMLDQTARLDEDLGLIYEETKENE